MRCRLGLLTALGLALATAACGGGGSTGPGASPARSEAPPPTPVSSSPGSATPSTGASRLSIVFDDGTGATTTWTLDCDPPGGSHPDAEGACAAIEAHRSALSPVPAGRMCAQVYSGPERATVTGSWRGERISTTLARTDACETARWDALVPLVPPGGR